MNLQIPQSISNSSTLQDLIRFASVSLQRIQTIVNGNIGLVDNCSTNVISFTFTKINSDVGVAHSLGRTPTGYIQVASDNPLLGTANGNTPSTSSTFYLQAGSTGTISVMVF